MTDTPQGAWMREYEQLRSDLYNAVCGRWLAGSTIQTRVVYAADALPRETLCVLCGAVIDQEIRGAA